MFVNVQCSYSLKWLQFCVDQRRGGAKTAREVPMAERLHEVPMQQRRCIGCRNEVLFSRLVAHFFDTRNQEESLWIARLRIKKLIIIRLRLFQLTQRTLGTAMEP